MRRIAAIVLPHLACELAGPSESPLAVVWLAAGEQATETLRSSAVLYAVNDVASRYGVRAGQTATEARALVANLIIKPLPFEALRASLGAVAEVALEFGPTSSIDLGDEHQPPDTVWIDLTGCCHLTGGEEATAMELVSRVRAIGHHVRVAIASGPRLARAAALHASRQTIVVASGDEKRAMGGLPLEVLSLSTETVSWFARLGLWTVSDLANLPAASAAVRLGERAREALDLAAGRDDTPLRPYEPPRQLSEEVSWDDPVSGIEPLLFALRRATTRIASRLQGRGEATSALEIEVRYDRAIADLNKVKDVSMVRVELPSALSRQPDLFAVAKAKLENEKLAAPAKALSVVARCVLPAPKLQLDFGGSMGASFDALPVLLAELSAEIGVENVGLVHNTKTHRPEAQTKLEPVVLNRAGTKGEPSPSYLEELPIRLLPRPVTLGALGRARGIGATVVIDQEFLFTLTSAAHHLRLDRVEWWTNTSISRDYARAWLKGASGGVEAWIYVDRQTNEAFLHGYFD